MNGIPFERHHRRDDLAGVRIFDSHHAGYDHVGVTLQNILDGAGECCCLPAR